MTINFKRNRSSTPPADLPPGCAWILEDSRSGPPSLVLADQSVYSDLNWSRIRRYESIPVNTPPVTKSEEVEYRWDEKLNIAILLILIVLVSLGF